MTRRLLALALATVVLGPLAPIAGVWASARECREHVCLCARHCPPRRAAAQPCHASEPEAAGVRAACDHDQAAGLASIAPALLPVPARVATTTSFVLAGAASVQSTASGFDSVLAPPPKRS